MKKKYTYLCAALTVIIFSLLIYCNLKEKKVTNIDSAKETCSFDNDFNGIMTGVLILSEPEGEYESIGSMFKSVGFTVVKDGLIKLKESYRDVKVLVVPFEEALKLDKESEDYIINWTKDGGHLITSGKSSLSQKLGMDFYGEKIQISGYRWASHPGINIRFKNKAEGFGFNNDNKFKTLGYVSNKEKPFIVYSPFNKGGFIFSAIDLAPESGFGFDYFPFLLEAVRDDFGIKPNVKRDSGAVYVDIGYHYSESPEKVAERVKSCGFSQANISMWYPIEDYYDYFSKLIEELHKKGIKVYAWFEFPMVSQKFWDEHPKWREKTALEMDASIDWRKLMALEDENCLREVIKIMQKSVKALNFDGVDIAEIYFETPNAGFILPMRFTPMHESFREGFKQKYGVDPLSAFNIGSKYYWMRNDKMKKDIIEYRVALINNIHEGILKGIEEIKKSKPYIESSVTVIDSLTEKRMREDIGVDIMELSKLQKKYDFAFQVEDPFTLWNLGPIRYKTIGENYRKIIGEKGKLNIDINVVNRMNNDYPYKKQRGIELYELMSYASKYTDNIIIYGLNTIEEDDMYFAPYTRVSDVKFGKEGEGVYKYSAKKDFIWETNTRGKTFLMDGKIFTNYSQNEVFLLGGEHKIQVVE